MRRSVFALGLALLNGSILAAARRAFAGQPSAAELPVYGTVVSVDRTHNTIVLDHAALETMPAGRHRCRFRHAADGKRLRPGSVIEASADTRHHPWTLDEVRLRN